MKIDELLSNVDFKNRLRSAIYNNSDYKIPREKRAFCSSEDIERIKRKYYISSFYKPYSSFNDYATILKYKHNLQTQESNNYEQRLETILSYEGSKNRRPYIPEKTQEFYFKTVDKEIDFNTFRKEITFNHLPQPKNQRPPTRNHQNAPITVRINKLKLLKKTIDMEEDSLTHKQKLRTTAHISKHHRCSTSANKKTKKNYLVDSSHHRKLISLPSYSIM